MFKPNDRNVPASNCQPKVVLQNVLASCMLAIAISIKGLYNYSVSLLLVVLHDQLKLLQLHSIKVILCHKITKIYILLKV